MSDITNKAFIEDNYYLKLEKELSNYKERHETEGYKVDERIVENPYFLIQNEWKPEIFNEIEHFKLKYKKFRERHKHNVRIIFDMASESLNTEFKYVYYRKLFNEEWSLNTAFVCANTNFKCFKRFLKEKYPNLQSLHNLDVEKVDREWHLWLTNSNISVSRSSNIADRRKILTAQSTVRSFFKKLHKDFVRFADFRIEWEKDTWNIRTLHDIYGVKYNHSKTPGYLNFSVIKNASFREVLKKFFKKRLLEQSLVAQTAQHYLDEIQFFLNFINDLQPKWNSLSHLTRDHMLKYIEKKTELVWANNKITNKERYISHSLIAIKTFLTDLQKWEYDIAPLSSVNLLLFPEDKPKIKKKPYDQIDHIPDFVLEQLFRHINDLHIQVQPVIWVAFKTGLRISDVLRLNQSCLVKLNGKYQIVTDIEKTLIKGHIVPIDEELANIIGVLIQQSIKNSNEVNNPNQYIFIRYSGPRKGMPYSQSWIRDKLNRLAFEKNIVDEQGEIFHFGIHQFRHTYAVKLLNSGTDILTVQELLAHSSPEMTLRYAKLLDETKRKAFEEAVNQGVFTFDLDGKIHEVDSDEEVPRDIFEMLWRNQKLTAVDNPYGSCRARLNGSCPYAEEPPCLTCNGGKPCKDLAVGISEMDIAKYEIHIQSTSKMIEVANLYGRAEIVEKNQRNLERLKGIYQTIKSGNIIFGRIERVKNKKGF